MNSVQNLQQKSPSYKKSINQRQIFLTLQLKDSVHKTNEEIKRLQSQLADANRNIVVIAAANEKLLTERDELKLQLLNPKVSEFETQTENFA